MGFTESEIATLRTLADSGLALTANNIAFNIGKSNQTARGACKMFIEEGYVEKVQDRGTHPFYQATEAGIEYVEDNR